MTSAAPATITITMEETPRLWDDNRQLEVKEEALAGRCSNTCFTSVVILIFFGSSLMAAMFASSETLLIILQVSVVVIPFLVIYYKCRKRVTNKSCPEEIVIYQSDNPKDTLCPLCQKKIDKKDWTSGKHRVQCREKCSKRYSKVASVAFPDVYCAKCKGELNLWTDTSCPKYFTCQGGSPICPIRYPRGQISNTGRNLYTCFLCNYKVCIGCCEFHNHRNIQARLKDEPLKIVAAPPPKRPNDTHGIHLCSVEAPLKEEAEGVAAIQELLYKKYHEITAQEMNKKVMFQQAVRTIMLQRQLQQAGADAFSSSLDYLHSTTSSSRATMATLANSCAMPVMASGTSAARQYWKTAIGYDTSAANNAV